jgi:hypothetical protein
MFLDFYVSIGLELGYKTLVYTLDICGKVGLIIKI